MDGHMYLRVRAWDGGWLVPEIRKHRFATLQNLCIAWMVLNEQLNIQGTPVSFVPPLGRGNRNPALAGPSVLTPKGGRPPQRPPPDPRLGKSILYMTIGHHVDVLDKTDNVMTLLKKMPKSMPHTKACISIFNTSPAIRKSANLPMKAINGL